MQAWSLFLRVVVLKLICLEKRMSSRREFLRTISGAIIATGVIRPSSAWAEQDGSLSIVGKDGMIVRSSRFLDLESPTEYLNSFITPVPHFFVRNHMHEPSTLDAQEWKLIIAGEVEKPYSLTLAELAKLEARTVVNTLECAGNGRSLQNPKVAGVQWGKGAVGTARFSGPQLKTILEKAAMKSTARHVMFRGLDEVPGKVPPFIRSIPIEKAIDVDTLIATKMNGAPLTKHHGFPARALVPGWIGAASCKWITEIKLLDKPFEGNFMSPGYRLPNQPMKPGDTVKPEDTHSVTALDVKSVIATPANDAILKSKSVTVTGAAWAGEAEISKVEISTDAGVTWQPATLGTDRAKYAWRIWSYRWKPLKPGAYTILSRATDTKGRTQPSSAVWNPSGYLYNAYDEVNIHVQA